jgi:hypothetical protein
VPGQPGCEDQHPGTIRYGCLQGIGQLIYGGPAELVAPLAISKPQQRDLPIAARLDPDVLSHNVVLDRPVSIFG